MYQLLYVLHFVWGYKTYNVLCVGLQNVQRLYVLQERTGGYKTSCVLRFVLCEVTEKEWRWWAVWEGVRL